MPSLTSIGLICYPTIGGSGRIATELAEILARRGHDVHLLSYERPVWLSDRVSFHRVEVMEYPLLRYPPYDQALAVRVAELAEQQGVQLFHAHYAVPHAVAVRLAELILDPEGGSRRLRLVTTLHGTDITLVGSNPAYRRAVSLGLAGSDAVTAVSQSLVDDTRRLLGFDGAIRVIPNFVDGTAFRPGSAPRWPDRPPGCPRELVHISTFRPVKRVLDLCQAVRLLADALPVRLTLVGDGPELAPALAWCRDHGLADAVRAVGIVNDPSPYLADADLYVFSSQTESFGLGVLEAMASAVPVVGPAVGGVGEVLGDPPVGRLVSPEDPGALAGAARELLTDAALYRSLCRRARERALAVFPSERVVPQYLEVYEQALR